MIASFVTLAERPDLIEAMWSMPNTWAPFMLQDPVGTRYFGQLPDRFPEFQVLALDRAGSIVGKVHSVPFSWTGSEDNLPERGWDGIIERAFDETGPEPANAASLIEARLAPEHRGTGLSRELLAAARGNAARLGARDLFGPVRPTGKAEEPRTPMPDYAGRVRSDGLPVDPWLRVHVRLGARIVKVCPLSMVVPGTLGDWREWTGLPLKETGLHDVPEGLVPVHVSVEHDHAVYVEPNVWVHHRLVGAGAARASSSAPA
ncbi:MAG: hypothetical protein QOE27_1487 [Solirubrobacteraceae bacterium]|nr:hypothetical protein [Solirubrobacteraceae bacterium]